MSSPDQTTYTVRLSAELSDVEIKAILETWDVEDWKNMVASDFLKRFEKSEFHLLTDPNSTILSIARINFNFKVKMDEEVYPIAELVGFVTTEILKGYDKKLLALLSENLKNRKIESVGFCKNKYSPFYESSGFQIYRNKVKFLREKKGDQWFTPREEDDIINLTLTENTIELFEKLSDENPAFLLFE